MDNNSSSVTLKKRTFYSKRKMYVYFFVDGSLFKIRSSRVKYFTRILVYGRVVCDSVIPPLIGKPRSGKTSEKSVLDRLGNRWLCACVWGGGHIQNRRQVWVKLSRTALLPSSQPTSASSILSQCTVIQAVDTFSSYSYDSTWPKKSLLITVSIPPYKTIESPGSRSFQKGPDNDRLFLNQTGKMFLYWSNYLLVSI